jgi:hypothetical protein
MPFNSRCKTMRAKVVLEDVDVKENVAKTHVAQKYYLARLRIKLQKMCL